MDNIIKKWNSKLTLLWKIKELSPISKKELQIATGVSWGLVSKVVNTLEEKEYIVAKTRTDSGVGRNAEEYDINSTKYLSIGVEITCDSIISVVTDLKGRIVEKEYISLDVLDREHAIEAINTSLDKIVSNYNKEDLLGIGFSVQGIVDREKGISDHIHKIKGWDYVPLKDIYEERYGLKVNVEHNTDCLMKSESDIGCIEANDNNVVLCNISHRFGIGVTMMINGELYHGASGKAGEIGSTPIEHNENGPVYINDIVRRKDLIRMYKESTNQDIEYHEFVDKVLQGEDEATKIYKYFGEKISFALAAVCNVVNPSVLIISFSGCELGDVLFNMIDEYIKVMRFDDSLAIIKSILPKEASAIGAALNMAQEAVGEMLQ